MFLFLRESRAGISLFISTFVRSSSMYKEGQSSPHKGIPMVRLKSTLHSFDVDSP